MKYIGLLVFLAMIPVVAQAMLSGSYGKKAVAFVVGFVPFFGQAIHLAVAPISWKFWPGYVKGLEFSAIDALALGILIAMPRTGAGARGFHLAPFFLLMAFALVSAIHAVAPTAALFVPWQMARVCLLYVAAARLAADGDRVRGLIAGMVLGLMCNAAWAAIQHLRGTYQAPGLFDHQNTLGMIAHFVALPAAALFVADRRAKWALCGIAAAGAVAILGASRATIGLEAAGLALLIAAIAAFWPSKRAFALLAMGAIALAALSPVAFAVLAPRFASVEHSDYDEREAFTRSTLAMLHDHPLGTGANHYVIVANTQGYSNVGQVGWGQGSRSANVHNAYLLTAAEMGWAALVPFVWLSVLSVINGFYWCFRSPDRYLSVMLMGASMAGLVVAIHNAFEWVFVSYAVQVVFCLNLGVMAGLIGQIRAARSSRRRVGLPAEVDGGFQEIMLNDERRPGRA